MGRCGCVSTSAGGSCRCGAGRGSAPPRLQRPAAVPPPIGATIGDAFRHRDSFPAPVAARSLGIAPNIAYSSCEPARLPDSGDRPRGERLSAASAPGTGHSVKIAPGLGQYTDAVAFTDAMQRAASRIAAGDVMVARYPAVGRERRATNARWLNALRSPLAASIRAPEKPATAVGSLGATAMDSAVTLNHGDAHVSVSAAFALEKTIALVGGSPDVLSWTETLRILWPDFLDDAAAVGIPRDPGYHAWWGFLFGCWNIDTSGNDYLFFREVGGAPLFVEAYMLSMVRTYAHLIDDHASGTTQGVGFGDAVATFLDAPGGATCSTNHDEPGHAGAPWWFYIHAASDDGAAGGVWPDVGDCGSTSINAPLTDAQREFSIGRKSLYGTPYSYVSLETTAESGGAYNALTLTQDADSYDHMFVQASTIAGAGRWCDVLLWWAWLAIEYCLDAPDMEELSRRLDSHFAPAWMLGRAVLRRLLKLARLHVHEAGHSWNGHGHCDEEGVSQKGYFMEAALHPFTCGVVARLGLPSNEECIPTTGVTSANPRCMESPEKTDALRASYMWGICSIAEPGSVGSAWRECSSGWCAETSVIPECVGVALGDAKHHMRAEDRACDAVYATPSKVISGQYGCGCWIGATSRDFPKGVP